MSRTIEELKDWAIGIFDDIKRNSLKSEDGAKPFYVKEDGSFNLESREDRDEDWHFIPGTLSIGFQSLIPNYITGTNGASRIVLIDENYDDYVLKIQYSDMEYNYNGNEEYVYKDAVANGVGAYFAEVKYLCDYEIGGGIMHIYAAEYCNCDSDDIEQSFSDYSFETYCDDNGYNPDDEEIRDEFWDKYSPDSSDQEEMLEFAGSTWLWQDYDMVREIIEKYNINDLHSGNWGYKHGILAITDYAGYCRNIGENI